MPKFTGSFSDSITVSACDGSLTLPLRTNALMPPFELTVATAGFGTVGAGESSGPLTVTVHSGFNRMQLTDGAISTTSVFSLVARS